MSEINMRQARKAFRLAGLSCREIRNEARKGSQTSLLITGDGAQSFLLPVHADRKVDGDIVDILVGEMVR